MAEAVFGADFGGTLIVSKKYDFDIRVVEQTPALQRIALDDSDVAPNGFAVVKIVSMPFFCFCLAPSGRARDRSDASISLTMEPKARMIRQL